MNSNLDTVRLEKEVWRTYHSDGLWDLFLGVWFVATAVAFALDQVYLVGIWAAILIPAVQRAHRSLIISRLGYARFTKMRQARISRARSSLGIMTGLGVILGVLVWLAWSGAPEMVKSVHGLGILPFVFLLAILIGGAGLLFGVVRFFWYAVGILGLFSLLYFLGSDVIVPFAVTGAALTAAGVVRLARFLRRYPKGQPEVTDGAA